LHATTHPPPRLLLVELHHAWREAAVPAAAAGLVPNMRYMLRDVTYYFLADKMCESAGDAGGPDDREFTHLVTRE
jgi:hypothetical protein